MTNPFAGFGDARSGRASNYISPGHYLLRVDKCKVGESRKKQGFIAVEFTVVHVYAADSKHKVGEEVTWMLMTHHDSWQGDFKGFLSAITNTPEHMIEDSDGLEVVGEGQPLSGRVIEANVWTKQTKSGVDFTKISWKDAPTPETVGKLLSPQDVTRFFPNGVPEPLPAPA